MEPQLISVIIPAYNCEQLVGRAIESILEQSHTEFEIIVVDDASQDQTVRAVKAYDSQCRLCVLENKVNMRQGAARNRGIEIASGGVVYFLDADDWLHPKALENMLCIMNDTGSDVVACGIQRIDSAGVTSLYHAHSFQCFSPAEALAFYADYKIGAACGNKLISKKMLQSNNLRFIEHYYHEDIIFTGYLALYCKKYTSISERYLSYYINENSTTRGVRTKLHLESYINIYIELLKFVTAIHLRGIDSPQLVRKLFKNYGSAEVFPKLIAYAASRTVEEFRNDVFAAAESMLGLHGYAFADAICVLFESHALREGSV